MSQSSPIVLASGQLNRSGDTLIIELIQPDSMPAVVRIVWPPQPSITQPTPKALAALAAAMVRTLAEAQTELREDQDWTVATKTRADRTFKTLCRLPLVGPPSWSDGGGCQTVHQHRTNNPESDTET